MESFAIPSHLTANTENEEHEEEQNGPEIRQRHPRHRLRVSDKSQSRAALDHLFDRHLHLLGQKPEHGEYHEAGENGRE